MSKYVVFGAGYYAERAIRVLGEDNIEFILDNDKLKWGKQLNNIEIKGVNECVGELDQYCIVISVSEKSKLEIIEQLQTLKLINYSYFAY